MPCCARKQVFLIIERDILAGQLIKCVLEQHGALPGTTQLCCTSFVSGQTALDWLDLQVVGAVAGVITNCFRTQCEYGPRLLPKLRMSPALKSTAVIIACSNVDEPNLLADIRAGGGDAFISKRRSLHRLADDVSSIINTLRTADSSGQRRGWIELF